MHWKIEELDKAIALIKSGKTFIEVGLILNRNRDSVRIKLNKLGIKASDFKPKKILKYCEECNNLITNYGNKYCSSSCSAIISNKKRAIKNNCKHCNKSINKLRSFCSKICEKEFKILIISDKIEAGLSTLTSASYKKFLIRKYGEACMECGWNKINNYSKKIPIELEHIDGNSENNNLNNLKLLCPNCHSLTPTYKGLNKGKGRHKRRERYKLGKSF